MGVVSSAQLQAFRFHQKNQYHKLILIRENLQHLQLVLQKSSIEQESSYLEVEKAVKNSFKVKIIHKVLQDEVYFD